MNFLFLKGAIAAAALAAPAVDQPAVTQAVVAPPHGAIVIPVTEAGADG